MGSLKTPLATLGILSIGDMGVGIARLLAAHDYRIITNASDRSPATQNRARKNDIGLVASDTELVNESHYILSIVPPRDALATAQRIATAASGPAFAAAARPRPLYFVDLNAISPASARAIAAEFAARAPHVRYIDGGIVGGPPKRDPSSDGGSAWTAPSVPVSGPHRLDAAEPSGAHLAATLRVRHINDTIGSATGLKMCFAALSKGATALAIQSFTAARNLGVLDELKTTLASHNPNVLKAAERSLPAMCPKAYRWVREMEEIAATFEVDGGFDEAESSFRSIARVYDLIANGTVLGEEKTEDRVKGKTSEEVAQLIGESTSARKVKTD